MTPREIHDSAKAEGLTAIYFIDFGSTDLTVWIDPQADFDGTFKAVDVETGERLSVNGWLAYSFERV